MEIRFRRAIDALSAGTTRIGTVTLLVTGIGIAMAVLLVVVLSSSLTRRLNKLVVSMRHTRTGDFDKRVRISGDDEISLLAASYNQMLDHLEQNISDLAEIKVLQQEAVLSALQAQINAHFLYNTLEFINAMAYMAGHQEIRRAVVSLSKMLRYTSTTRIRW